MKIRVLVVEPSKAPRVETIENTLEAMQKVVGGYIEPVTPLIHDDDAILICNEEGKLLDLPISALLCDGDGNVYDAVCGTFFICKAPEDSEDFESLTDEQIAKYSWIYSVLQPVELWED